MRVGDRQEPLQRRDGVDLRVSFRMTQRSVIGSFTIIFRVLNNSCDRGFAKQDVLLDR